MTCECECHRKEQAPKKRSAPRRFFKTLFRASRGFFSTRSKAVPEKKIELEKSEAMAPRADDEDRSTRPSDKSRTRTPEERREPAPGLPGPSTGICHLDCNFPDDTIKISYVFKCPAATLQNLRNAEIERLNYAVQTNCLSNAKFCK